MADRVRRKAWIRGTRSSSKGRRFPQVVSGRLEWCKWFAAFDGRQPSEETHPGAVGLFESGVHYAESPTGDRAENLDRSVRDLAAAAALVDPAELSYWWAMVQYNLAMSLVERSRDHQADDIERAIGCYRVVTRVLRTELPLLNWITLRGEALGNLGGIYLDLTTGSRALNLERCIRILRRALDIQHPSWTRRAWGVSQQNLGTAYQLRVLGDRRRNLRKAIAAYQAALTVRSEDREPALYRRTAEHLTVARAELAALSGRGGRVPPDVASMAARVGLTRGIALAMPALAGSAGLADPVAALAEFQRVRRQTSATDSPLAWARVNHSIGVTYQHFAAQLSLETSQALGLAIEAYQAALQALTPEVDQSLWGSVLHNLGAAYLAGATDAEGIDLAIDHLRRALPARTRTKWARTQYTLACAYLNRAIKSDTTTDLDKAVEAAECALEVLSPETARVEHSRAQINLGLALVQQAQARPTGADIADVRRGVSALRSALAANAEPLSDRDRSEIYLSLTMGCRMLATLEPRRADRLDAQALARSYLRQARETTTELGAGLDRIRVSLDLMLAMSEGADQHGDPAMSAAETIERLHAALQRMDPDDDERAWALYLLGNAHRRMLPRGQAEHVEAAIEAYQSCLAILDPDHHLHPDVERALGDVYCNNGAVADSSAAEHYRAALAAQLRISRPINWETVANNMTALRSVTAAAQHDTRHLR